MKHYINWIVSCSKSASPASKSMRGAMIIILSLYLFPAWAQGDMKQHRDHAARDGPLKKMTGMKHGDKPQARPEPMQGGPAPANARDPHAFADGHDFGPITPPRLGDEYNFGSLLVDRLETVTTNNRLGIYDLQAWYGRDYQRIVLKAEGEINAGKIEATSTEILWSQAIAPYWDIQLGLRGDSAEVTERYWLAAGIQGLAPYWFEIDISAYLSTEGYSALILEAEYELLLTQKLILQSRIEAEIAGKNENEPRIAAGLSERVAGLRLRYEYRREFAPYIGIEWTAQYGAAIETRGVAGIRFWF